MKTESPLVSVVVSVLNARSTLQRCIDSVAAQTCARKELVVMDGASTDGSVDIIKRNDAAIAYWESQPDGGMYHAFNKALTRCRGEWVYILGADDYFWQTDVLERMAPHLERAAGSYRIVYAQAAFVSESGEVLEILGKPWSEFRGRFLQGFMLPHQAVFHHRTLFEVHGPFDERFRSCGDYEMLLRELKQADPLFVPGVIVAGYQFGGDSSDPSNSIKVLQMFRKAQRLNGLVPGPLWYAALARVLVRAALWKVLGERGAKRVLDWGRALLGKPAFWTRI
jgi:hypothetical protein